jgi:predicted PurR-regulated permease PerM
MTVWTRWWLVILAVCLALIYLLSGVLVPFIAGMATAYFLDPIADRLERWGLSRTSATLAITAAFFVLVVTVIIVLETLIEGQLAELI